MKNILLKIFLLVSFFLFIVSSVNAIEVINSSSKENSCNGANVNRVVYIDSSSKMKFVYDEFWTSDDRLISNNKTKVSIWQSDSNLLESCKDTNSWKRISSLSPGNNKHVIAVGANCTFKKPTNRNKRTLQFVYNIGYYDIFKNQGALIGDWDLEYYRNVEDIKKDNVQTKHYDNSGFKNLNVHDNECLNIELRYCGDGIISNGETCDPYASGFNQQNCSISTCTPINIITPKVEVDKTDANSDDLDNNERDSQLIYEGDKAVFKITVKNDINNKEALKDIVLTDARLSSCNKTSSQTKELIKKVGNHDEILDLGESFSYTCEGKYQDNQKNWINTIKVVATGVKSGKKDDDSDPTEVLVEVKSNPICTGLTVSPDNGKISFVSQFSCTAKDTRAYKIEVKDSNGKIVYSKKSNTASYNFTKEGNYTVTCYVNDRNTTENICIKKVSAIKDSSNKYDLALRKTVESGTGKYDIGDIVEYKIEVFNQGNKDASNIEVTDYVPEKMELVSGNGWSSMDSDRRITNTISSIKAGESENLVLKLKVLDGATGTIKNYAEISKDDGDDCDSIADNTNGNGDGESTDLDDDNIGTGCDQRGDEDDHDVAVITINGPIIVSDCEADTTGAQSSPISQNTSGLCKNSGEVVVDFKSVTSGDTTTYTWACKDSNNVIHTDGNCSASFTDEGGDGHGGSVAQCLDIIDNGSNSFTCVGDDDTRVFGIDCDGDGVYEQVKYSSNQSEFTKINNIYSYTFTCSTTNDDGTPATINPRCAVEKTYIAPNQSAGWNTSASCEYTIGEDCGNGKIEGDEECEKGSDGTWPEGCNHDTCKIDNLSTLPVHDGNLTTEPSQGEIGFVGMYDMIIGDKQNLSKLNGEIYIWNNSPYTFNNSVFNGVCLTTANINTSDDRYDFINTGDSLSNLGSREHCTDIITKFYPGQKIYLRNDLSDIIADKNKVDGDNYEDNKLVVTIRTTKDMSPYSNILNWSDNLTGKFKVRVAKPAIQTTGGTAYNKNAGANTKEIASNINTSTDYSQKSNNDVGVGTKSSDANTTNNENVVNDSENINNNSSNLTTTNTTFEKYNGLDNVLIKTGDTNLNDIKTNYLDSISKPMTFIIDGADLVIEDDLTGISQNIAFVVKNGGNIIIKDNVTEIQGTYIVLDDGKIKASGGETDNILTVKGSLYGDSSDLVDNRTNVKEENGELTFGTVVSFGSSVFRKPAPMVTKFINEYLESSKTAQ